MLIRHLLCFLGAHAWYYKTESLTAQSGEQIFISTWYCRTCGSMSPRPMFMITPRPTGLSKNK